MIESQFGFLKDDWAKEKMAKEHYMKQSADLEQQLTAEKHKTKDLEAKVRQLEADIIQRKGETDAFLKLQAESSYKIVHQNLLRNSKKPSCSASTETSLS